MVFGLLLILIGAFLLLWGLHGFGVLATIGGSAANAEESADG